MRKAREQVYHLRCFTCSVCGKQLSTGEVLYLQPGEDNTLLCKDDYLKQNGGTAGKFKSSRISHVTYPNHGAKPDLSI